MYLSAMQSPSVNSIHGGARTLTATSNESLLLNHASSDWLAQAFDTSVSPIVELLGHDLPDIPATQQCCKMTRRPPSKARPTVGPTASNRCNHSQVRGVHECRSFRSKVLACGGFRRPRGTGPLQGSIGRRPHLPARRPRRLSCWKQPPQTLQWRWGRLP